jgi:ABC-2 type transport system ATP-binding protein
MTEAIETRGLSKTYAGGVHAVDDVNLSVARGETFGFLGPNGAGKTTTISMLCTLLKPTKGSIAIDGIDAVARPEEVRRRIGLVFQRSTADGMLSGRENLEVAAGLQGLSPRDAAPRIRESLASLDLDDVADRRVKTYSGGMQRRLELAAATLHHPALLFLDEPTLGLDPGGRVHFWDYLRALQKSEPVTVFLSTHYLDEAEELSDRVSIIDHGSLKKVGTPAQLKSELGGDTVVVRTEPGNPRVARVLDAIEGVHGVVADGSSGTFRLRVARGGVATPAIVRAFDAAGLPLLEISAQTPRLDDVFAAATGRAYVAEGEPSGPMTAARGA